MTRARAVVFWSLLLAAFLVVHVVLALIDGYAEGGNYAADIWNVYLRWVTDWLQGGALVGVGTDWVYPLLALVPMIGAAAFGADVTTYVTTWMVIVLLLDAVALVALARRRMSLAWWWVGFTALLGPIALARIDAIALPFAILGALVAVERPAVASALFTVGAWIKVWPAAMVVALVLALRRTRGVLLAAAAVCAVVAGTALLLGGGSHVLSFITTQTGRGIQVEAPIALPWLWSAITGADGSSVYYDTTILTYQIRGPGVVAAAAAMTPVLAVGVLAIVALALVARRRGAEPGPLLAVTSLALVTALIALNKVGSPQYFSWFAAPVLLGLLVAPQRFRVPSVLVLVLAGLTQYVYPWFYGGPLATDAVALGVLTVRNLLELVLLAWSLMALRVLAAPEPVPVPAVEIVRTG